MVEQPSARGTILLVEDEPFVALVAQQVLEDHGFMVVVAGHGAAAIDHARDAFQSGGDGALLLALVDIGLPDIGGDEVVRTLRGLAPTLPIIIATGYAIEEIAAEFDGVARLVMIRKPYDVATLRGALREVGVAIPEEPDAGA
ncbi:MULTISPECIES: response regulator [unclassified Xanthobacter]|uniref:response regulator n=1 Tax=unclassified Xanthobacter TaxID=2623496 RepID=UPI001EDCA7F3